MLAFASTSIRLSDQPPSNIHAMSDLTSASSRLAVVSSIPSMNMFARRLCTQGVVVVPMFSAEEVRRIHREMIVELRKMGEYIDATKTSRYVDGGFGALANPSSFHNPVVRALRKDMSVRTLAFFRLVNTRLLSELNGVPEGEDPMAVDGEDPVDNRVWRIEQLMDRTSVRRTGTSTSSETWHRDQSPTKDRVFGGWVNLDVSGDQYFSCSPGSHIVANQAAAASSDSTTAVAAGFNKISASDVHAAKANQTTFVIPSGHWIVFFQDLVHEVNPRKATYDSMRQYFGFRITRSILPLWEEARPDKDFYPSGIKGSSKAAKAAAAKSAADFNWRQRVFRDQGPPPLPSGQYPPLWAKLTLCFRKEQLEAWSKEIKPAFLNDAAGIPLRFMPSLVAAHLPLYSAYTDEEIAIHTPQPL